MANTIAWATGHDNTREKTVHRLGSECADTTAATFRTFANACVYKDGSGYVEVRQNGKTIHVFNFGPES